VEKDSGDYASQTPLRATKTFGRTRKLGRTRRLLFLAAPLALGLTGCDSCDRVVRHFASKSLKQAPAPAVHTHDDDIAAAVAGPAAADATQDASPQMSIQCSEPTKAVSPTLFGIAFADADLELNASAYRWGGNTTSRYNPKINAWNSGNDWFWENVQVDSADVFLGKVENRAGVAAITVPIMGWVAKDGTSGSYPLSAYPDQAETDPQHPEYGNGKKKDGTLLAGEPARTSVPITPADVGAWVKALKAADAKRGKKLVYEYILDNEPGLWDSTHRDVHPDGSTYDELVQKAIAFGAAIRAADPDALIAGPAEWGWPNYFFSGKDVKAGYSKKPDRLAHGDVPFLKYYLSELRKYREKTNTRVLDVLDIHFYPQAEHVQHPDGPDNSGGGSTDPETNELRFRQTRALWDCTYVDESWINEAQCIVPRMKQLIAENDPGLKLQIGEWNFGAESHPAGGVALAEALGRFAQYGVDSAYYWTYPRKGTPAYWAFRAFRNYDGKGGHFLEQLVPTHAPAGTSLYASRDATGKKTVAIALNFSADTAKTVTLQTPGCAPASQVKAYSSDIDAKGLQPLEAASAGTSVKLTLKPYSVTVIEITRL
jgi:hypothetical protein